jgi:phosphoribosyl 1,2-cyclic phosphodiesterase
VYNICVNVISLQSGSSGNCIYIETGNKKFLFDAGISSVEAERRLSAFGRNMREVDALIISHDHGDHVRHAGVYQRKYGLPVFITQKTFGHAAKRHNLGKLDNIHFFSKGEAMRFDEVVVQSVPSPHDGVDGSVFVVSSFKKQIGIFTDIGFVSEDIYQTVSTLDAVFIESNYDPDMLKKGDYPAFLKQRITGPHGHLSNRQSAELLLAGDNLKWACLAHLSNNNNDPLLALKTHREIVSEDLQLYVASRYEATGILSV